MVKVRAVNRDYFRVGKIEEGFLVFKGTGKKSEKRISVGETGVFYRCMAVSWVDVDEQTNNICKPDYALSPGFDAEKTDSLYKRALYKPAIMDTNEKIIIVMIALSIVMQIILAIMLYKVFGSIDGLTAQVNSVKVATITAGGL